MRRLSLSLSLCIYTYHVMYIYIYTHHIMYYIYNWIILCMYVYRERSNVVLVKVVSWIIVYVIEKYIYIYIYIYILFVYTYHYLHYTYRSVYEHNRLFRKPPLLEPPLSCAIIYIYIHIYDSLIADSSDKGSHGGQKKNNIEWNVTLQILSTVDSTGKNIGARKWPAQNVTTIVRNGRFVRPDHRSAVTTR